MSQNHVLRVADIGGIHPPDVMGFDPSDLGNLRDETGVQGFLLVFVLLQLLIHKKGPINVIAEVRMLLHILLNNAYVGSDHKHGRLIDPEDGLS